MTNQCKLTKRKMHTGRSSNILWKLIISMYRWWPEENHSR